MLCQIDNTRPGLFCPSVRPSPDWQPWVMVTGDVHRTVPYCPSEIHPRILETWKATLSHPCPHSQSSWQPDLRQLGLMASHREVTFSTFPGGCPSTRRASPGPGHTELKPLWKGQLFQGLKMVLPSQICKHPLRDPAVAPGPPC